MFNIAMNHQNGEKFSRAKTAKSALCHRFKEHGASTTVFQHQVHYRGGVEDTRLEAKAKDTKKIRGQGQGQPFRGQTLSRPRTGMLEAKAKDQGHQAQVLSKKKKKRSSQKFFRRSQKKKKKKRSSQNFFKRSPKKKSSSQKLTRSPLKNVFQKIFQPLHKILTFQKIVLSSSRGQANFRGLEVSRPRPRTWPSRPRPRTSKCVLEDSTSGSLICVQINDDLFAVGTVKYFQSPIPSNFYWWIAATS